MGQRIMEEQPTLISHGSPDLHLTSLILKGHYSESRIWFHKVINELKFNFQLLSINDSCQRVLPYSPRNIVSGGFACTLLYSLYGAYVHLGLSRELQNWQIMGKRTMEEQSSLKSHGSSNIRLTSSMTLKALRTISATYNSTKEISSVADLLADCGIVSTGASRAVVGDKPNASGSEIRFPFLIFCNFADLNTPKPDRHMLPNMEKPSLMAVQEIDTNGDASSDIEALSAQSHSNTDEGSSGLVAGSTSASSGGRSGTGSNDDQDNRYFAKRETASVRNLKFLVLIVLLMVAVAVCLAVYFVMSHSQQAEFDGA